MPLMLRDGDYMLDSAGRLRSADGQEALVQRVLLRLSARRGKFPFWQTLGSQLWTLGQLPQNARQSAAAQYVAEALAEEDLQVESVTLSPLGDQRMLLEANLTVQGENLTVSLELQ